MKRSLDRRRESREALRFPEESKALILRFVEFVAAQAALELRDVSRSAATNHFRLMLYRQGQGMDGIILGEISHSIHMEYVDAGEDGFVDSGDLILIDGLETGEYEAALEYAGIELWRYPFTV